MRSLSRIARATVPALVIACAQCAFGGIVTISAEGRIKGMFDAAFDHSVQAGIRFSATFRIDTSAYVEAVNGVDRTFGYHDEIGADGVSLVFGNYSFLPNAAFPNAYNRLAGAVNGVVPSKPGPGIAVDNLYVTSLSGGGNGFVRIYALMTLFSDPYAALSGSGIPPSGPGLNDIGKWNRGTEFYFEAWNAQGNRSIWDGEVDSIHTAAVATPEGRTLTFAFVGLAAWIGRTIASRRRG